MVRELDAVRVVEVVQEELVVVDKGSIRGFVGEVKTVLSAASNGETARGSITGFAGE